MFGVVKRFLVASFVLLLVAPSMDLAVASNLLEQKTKAPNFKSTGMDGEKIQLEDFLGKGPVVVDFWATWCKPCIKELPYIQRMHEEYEEQGLTVLAVTIDSPRSQSRVKPFIKGRKFTFQVVMDGSQDVFRGLQGRGTIPYVVVIDPEGYVRYRHTGYRPGDEVELENVVKEILAETAGEEAGETAPEPGTAEPTEEAEADPAPEETTG